MKNNLEIKKREVVHREVSGVFPMPVEERIKRAGAITLDLSTQDEEFKNLKFGEALELAKRGFRIARAGWNGQGMYAYIVPAASYPAQTEHAKKEFGDMVPYRAYWALKTAQNDVATWTPSGSDTLAEDWVVYEN